jgi:hypothetical protein
MERQDCRRWLAGTDLSVVQIDELCHWKLVTVEEGVLASNAETLVNLHSTHKKTVLIYDIWKKTCILSIVIN